MPSSLEDLRAALKGRYEIEREIGQGGMATVYLARDVKHKRQVAVKVLRPDLAAALGADRFLREIEIAANLTHPHILPLYDSGEADGFLYYVMPYIKGDTLRERIDKEGELPVSEAVRIIREVTDALAFAHSQGVVHRDIKPDNIMLSGRHAMVMDFGVAKAVSEATGRNTLTTAGVALGTPTYMAPEQATADPHVDHRADIYAVGIMAYELLAGRTPFQRASPQAVLAAHVTEEAEPISKHRDHVSGDLEALVMKCLAKKPADRWQSADEMLPHLEAMAGTSGGITPTQTRPVTVVGARNRNVALIAAALVGAGAIAAAGFLLRSGDDATDLPAPIDRQVTFRGDVSDVALAGDGRTIVYQADEGRSLIVQDLAGGGSNTIVRLEDPALTISGLYWGPDDSRVFFNLWSDTSDVIASVPRLGGPLRTEGDLLPLRRPRVGFSGVTASGEYLIGTGSWIYLGTAPETVRWVNEDSLVGYGTLINVGAPVRYPLILSPNGRWIAYVAVREGSRFVGGLISTDGTQHAILAEGTTEFYPTPRGWSPASDAVYYERYSDNRTDIVRLPIDPGDGARAGEPVVVMRGVRARSRFLVQGTTMFYSGGAFSSNLKVIDLAGAPRATEHPTSMLTAGTASNCCSAPTPDGEVVVFQRVTGEGSDIYVRPTQGGVERLLTHRNYEMVASPDVTWEMVASPDITRDGSRFAYYEFGAAERTMLVIVDISTGGTTELPLGDGEIVAWSPDGQRVATSSDQTVNRIVLVDLRDSSEVVVRLQCDTDVEVNRIMAGGCSLRANGLAFSPDGTRIALTDGLGSGLWIAGLADGHATRITEEAGRALNWTEDWIYYTGEEIGPSGERYRVIYRIAPEGGTPELYARLPEDCSGGVSLSLDASTAVCSVDDEKPDVHIVENFDPRYR